MYLWPTRMRWADMRISLDVKNRSTLDWSTAALNASGVRHRVGSSA